MPGSYSVMSKKERAYDSRWSEPQLAYGSEGVISYNTYRINYINDEYADTHLIHGEARGNSTEAEQFYAERFPNHRTSSRHFEHQLWISSSVFICLFPYQINK
jgi:hypothetical protein